MKHSASILLPFWLRIHLPYLPYMIPCSYRALAWYAVLPSCPWPYIWFLFVRPEICLQVYVPHIQLYIHIHDHLNETVFMASCEGHDLPQILKDQFLQDNRSDGVWCATHLLSLAISRADVVFLILSEAGRSALVQDRATIGTIHHAGEHPHFAHLCRTAPWLPCLLYSLGNGFCPDGFMGILEDDPFTFRIFDCLFALVGLLCGLEIYRMPQVFTPAIHNMCYRGIIPTSAQQVATNLLGTEMFYKDDCLHGIVHIQSRTTPTERLRFF